MTKLTMKHHDALVRAETALIKGYEPTQSQPGRRQFDEDLILIAGLKKLVMRMIFEPGFQYGSAD